GFECFRQQCLPTLLGCLPCKRSQLLRLLPCGEPFTLQRADRSECFLEDGTLLLTRRERCDLIDVRRLVVARPGRDNDIPGDAPSADRDEEVRRDVGSGVLLERDSFDPLTRPTWEHLERERIGRRNHR